MPALVQIDYEITAAPSITIVRVDFDRKISADLAFDRMAAEPPRYNTVPPKSGQQPYIVSPKDETLNLFVFATGIKQGDAFSMKATFTIVEETKPGIFEPINGLTPVNRSLPSAVIDLAGKGVINQNVRWIK